MVTKVLPTVNLLVFEAGYREGLSQDWGCGGLLGIFAFVL